MLNYVIRNKVIEIYIMVLVFIIISYCYVFYTATYNGVVRGIGRLIIGGGGHVHIFAFIYSLIVKSKLRFQTISVSHIVKYLQAILSWLYLMVSVVHPYGIWLFTSTSSLLGMIVGIIKTIIIILVKLCGNTT